MPRVPSAAHAELAGEGRAQSVRQVLEVGHGLGHADEAARVAEAPQAVGVDAQGLEADLSHVTHVDEAEPEVDRTRPEFSGQQGRKGLVDRGRDAGAANGRTEHRPREHGDEHGLGEQRAGEGPEPLFGEHLGVSVGVGVGGCRTVPIGGADALGARRGGPGGCGDRRA